MLHSHHFPSSFNINSPQCFCSLIKSRLDNKFYRRVTAIQFDVRYIATNAECYNRPRTDIVKNARILTDLVLRIIQQPHLTDVNGEYHRLMDNFRWEDTQEPRLHLLYLFCSLSFGSIVGLERYRCQ